MVASLPVFVNVAVPQLAMKIAATQRKTFRDTSVEFIWRSFKSLILRRCVSMCQDLKTAVQPLPTQMHRLFKGYPQSCVKPESAKQNQHRAETPRLTARTVEKFAANYSAALSAAQR